jgi:hypothetical protein
MPSWWRSRAWKTIMRLVLLTTLPPVMASVTIALPIPPATASRLPLSPEVKAGLSDVNSGDFEAAIQIAQKVRKENPG